MWKVMSGIALLALAWVVCFPLGAAALPPQEIERYYFSGPDFQTLVGEVAWPLCEGGLLRWGKATLYKMVQIIPCECYRPEPSDPYCEWPEPTCYIYDQIVPCP